MSKKKIIIAIISIYLLIGLFFGIFTFIIFENPENLINQQTVQNFTLFSIIYLAILFIALSILINALKGKLLAGGLQKIFKNVHWYQSFVKTPINYTVHPEANNKDAIITELTKFRDIRKETTFAPGIIDLIVEHKDKSEHHYRAFVEGLQIKRLDRYS